MEDVYSVGELLAELQEWLAGEFGDVWIEGEIGELRRSRAGHLYLTLKDVEGQLDAVLFRAAARRLPLEPDEGQVVRAHGRVELYAPRGRLQLVLDELRPRGEGELRLAFERLRAALEAEGLFDPARKRALPLVPRRIGVVTSVHGAALHDFLRALGQRWPAADVLVCDASVQGEGAWREVVRALHLLDARDDVDVLVLTRGGGSLEDLWTFNREELVRAIVELETPLVSAIGHEVDVVLTDLAADARAPTPTAAAALVAPDAASGPVACSAGWCTPPVGSSWRASAASGSPAGCALPWSAPRSGGARASVRWRAASMRSRRWPCSGAAMRSRSARPTAPCCATGGRYGRTIWCA